MVSRLHSRLVVILVLVEILKDCSPKPTILCTFEPKIKHCKLPIKHCKCNADTIMFYQQIEHNGRTNQIRRFPVELWPSF